MKNVLVFPCGSEVGLEINRALAFSKHFKLFGGSSINDHGKFVYKNYIENVPFIEAPNFIKKINEIIKIYKIDFIIPAHDSVVLKMAENQNKINAIVIVATFNTCRICRSKEETYKFFNNLIPTPKIFNFNDSLNFPVFLKPNVGQGTKGTYKVYTKEELGFYLNNDPTLLILEYLPGKEYTVDCFTNKNRELLFSEGRERIRISNGICINSKNIKNPKFQQFANIINKNLSFQGAWFYQVKERENGELVLMEIAPRIAGSMALNRVLGINFVQLSLFDRMDFELSIINNNLNIELDRALFTRYSINDNYDYVYIDFDDTIVFDGNVNTDIIKFLYQSKNHGKKIILLSKHNNDIKETLSSYAISSLLFDEIILLKPNEIKKHYIKNMKSIFIDDSYNERKDVSFSLKIPCYGIDAIESLLYWKV